MTSPALTPDEIAALEQQWVGQIQISQPDVYFDWQPAPIDLFTRLLEACLPHIPTANQSFLDAGCGIGTKCLIAASYGLTAYGIDRVPEYLSEAARLGVATEQALIEDYARISGYGLVYLNHPLNCGAGCDDEARLERLVHDEMASGAVLLSINYDLAPGCTAHPPDRPCDENCPIDAYDGWTEVGRDGRWHAGWVKQ